jgi:nitroreductase
MTLHQLDHLTESMELLDPIAAGVHPLIAGRRSEADFLPEPLSRKQIVQLLQAARCAPSFHNQQPWHFIVITNGEGRQQIEQALQEGGADWAVTAPVFLAIIASLPDGRSLNGVDYTLFDAGLATQNILLQAAGMGLAAHPVNYYTPDTVRQALRLPETQELVLLIAVGYPGGADAKDTNASRLRKPLPAMAAWDRWDGSPVVEDAE